MDFNPFPVKELRYLIYLLPAQGFVFTSVMIHFIFQVSRQSYVEVRVHWKLEQTPMDV